jgi:hypothetical protein
MSFPHALPYSEVSPQVGSTENFVKRRWFELSLIIFTGFSGPLIRAIAYFRNGSASSGHFGNLRYLDSTFQEIAVLALLGYILHRGHRSFRDIGFRWSVKDAGAGILLFLASYIMYGIGSALIVVCYRFAHGNFPPHVDSRQIFGQMPWMALPFQLVNGFFEELVVRAYLMTEIRELTGSLWLASFASVVIQSSYHIYYGWVGMFNVAFLFMAFTIFFAVWSRSMPLVVAHTAIDMLAYIRLR